MSYQSIAWAYFLSLRSGVSKDDVDPEHLHDDGTKGKRHTNRQEPQTSYAESGGDSFVARRYGKQDCTEVEDNHTKHCDGIEVRTAETNQPDRCMGYRTVVQSDMTLNS